ncbi:hypothetical protein AX15_001760 [Amanita polypyramis BW_CC]|nr:hypothetical protein AX15_001760 [Amanita polypyramis BW_CC]
MAELPPIQQTANLPVIFCDDDGHPLRVFVEACGIVHRPKLVRTLKKAGAEICNDPKQAQIILVDSRTYEGRKFIRDWGDDVNKVVLEYAWVSNSLAAARALKEGDQWGNCLTHDDGLPLDSDANFDDEITNKSPLPTPRITPVGTSVAPAKAAEKHRLSTASVGQSSKVANVTIQDHEPFSMTQSSTMPFESAASSSSSAQNNGLRIPTPDAQILSNTIQQLAPGFLPYQPGVISPVQFMQQSMQAGMMAPMTQLQVWAQMMGPMLSQGAPQLNSDPFAISLIDALRAHGMVSYSIPQSREGSGTLPGQPDSGNSEPPEVVHPPTAVLPESDMVTTRFPTPAQASPVPHEVETSITGHPPQIGRRSAHLVRPSSPPEPSGSSVSQSKRQKRKDKSPEGRRKTIAYIGPTRSLYSTESPTRAPQENQSHKIFLNDKGRAMSFFVQVDQPSRLNVVSSIKKNGGKISNAQTTADYAILYSHSKTFIDLLTSTVEAGKIAVSAAFIHDSIKESALLDPTQYKFRLPGKAKKRATAHYSSNDVEEVPATEAAPKRKLTQNQGHQEKGKRAKQEDEPLNVNVQSLVKLEPEEVQLAFKQPRVPSPTPPPVHTQQSTTRGFKYPDIEREYALKYMKILLERDHQMSTHAMAEYLYRKLPHHTLKSWRSYISSVIFRDEVDKLRKKAAIAYKKSFDLTQPAHAEEKSCDANMNGVEIDIPGPVNMEEVRKKEEEDDLNTICNFFAFGGGDGQVDNSDQDALWARLSSKATCITANSWVEFYDRYYPVIQERYARLVGLEAQQNPTENDMNL